MTKSFWNKLSGFARSDGPFFALAPMKDVTDAAFRKIVARRGKPDVFWTEFVSADGLYHTITHKKSLDFQECEKIENPLARDLQFDEDERPIVAQIFSNKPDVISFATKLIEKFGFDGVDLNMGCPDRAIEKQGAGAALIKDPKLAVELICAAKKASKLPVSVKTRVGYQKESLEDWLPVLLEAAPAAITIHLRTRKEMSKVPANWELMKKAVEIRDKINPEVILIGNGDVIDMEDGKHKAGEAGCEGIMIGRAIFGNPWLFSGREYSDISLEEKLATLVELAQEFEKLNPPKNFAILKKHIKAFVTDFKGASGLRAKLMEVSSAKELEQVIKINRIKQKETLF